MKNKNDYRDIVRERRLKGLDVPNGTSTGENCIYVGINSNYGRFSGISLINYNEKSLISHLAASYLRDTKIQLDQNGLTEIGFELKNKSRRVLVNGD